MGEAAQLRLVDAAIVVLLVMIAARIVGANDPYSLLAGYVVMAATAATVPVFVAALWLGFRRY